MNVNDYAGACAALILIGLILLSVTAGLVFGAWAGTLAAGAIFLATGAIAWAGRHGDGRGV